MYAYYESQPSKEKSRIFIRYYCMLFSQSHFSVEQQGGWGSRNLAASKIETFAIPVCFWKPLTIISKGSILNMTGVPDLPVKCVSITL